MTGRPLGHTIPTHLIDTMTKRKKKKKEECVMPSGTTHPTNIDLIHHRRKMIEEDDYHKKKGLSWRNQPKNWDGLLLSMRWKLWSGAWTQAGVIYPATHIMFKKYL